MDIKQRLKDNLVIGIILGALISQIIAYVIIHYSGYALHKKTDYKDVGGNIDIEYYLEVSEDSIWVEGVNSKRVYSGKYKDLDSLITLDNL